MPQAREKLNFVDKTMQNNHDGFLPHLLDCHTAAHTCHGCRALIACKYGINKQCTALVNGVMMLVCVSVRSVVCVSCSAHVRARHGMYDLRVGLLL